ncbi:hypothetical protein [Nonomuraea sp. NPDC049400]|uniref:hypothetical protein n=1 Tax=Nonomuraea sp. NPDC049400 TaxID=3364352 RepID=UPI0037B3EC17
MDVKVGSTRWIIGSTAAALWVTTALAAKAELSLHWYLAIGMATVVASGGVLVCIADALTRAREAHQTAAGRAAFNEGIQEIRAAIGEHAERMEIATLGHADQLRRDVLTADRWLLTAKWRGHALAQHDAAAEAAQRGSDSGQWPIVSNGPH